MKKFKNLVLLSVSNDTVTIGVLENETVSYTETVGNGGGAFFFNNKLYYINDFI